MPLVGPLAMATGVTLEQLAAAEGSGGNGHNTDGGGNGMNAAGGSGTSLGSLKSDAAPQSSIHQSTPF
jgi:hypothetical protein